MVPFANRYLAQSYIKICLFVQMCSSYNLVVVSRRENWTSLVSGGECIVKQYVYFTHVCSVSNYLPNVDYCCCVHDAGLLCCRYHQGWNHFRCVESDDLVDTLYVYQCIQILNLISTDLRKKHFTVLSYIVHILL